MQIKEVIQYPNLNYKERVKQLEQNHRLQRQSELEQAFMSPEYWQILNKVEKQNIPKANLKLKKGGYVSADIEIRRKINSVLDPKTIYTFKDNGNEIGVLELVEKPNGAYIQMVKNFNQNKYGGIGVIADRIAVENCLKRGLVDFEVTGDAIWDSHAAHYLTGKRFTPIEDSDRIKILKRKFGTKNPNKIVKQIIENTHQGKKCHTDILKTVSFYLPKKLINKYVQLAKTNPILK